ncbi:MAG: hypothetical protein CMK32_06040 [Porticoccaceae bacterium]|nr:hypothetical protein [Porticoccaceae bacterium]
MQDYIKLVEFSRGFSLVEMMIVLAIIGLLALVVVPFTRSWIEEADVKEAISSLEVAYGTAKGLALRNPLLAGETPSGAKEPAAGIKVSPGLLLICQGDPESASCSPAGQNRISSYRVPDGVTININGSLLSVQRIDNTGQSIDGSGQAIPLSYSVTKGSITYVGEIR